MYDTIDALNLNFLPQILLFLLVIKFRSILRHSKNLSHQFQHFPGEMNFNTERSYI